MVAGIALQRLLTMVRRIGRSLDRGLARPDYHTAINVLAWTISIAASLGILFGAVFLMPAITSFVASFFVDDIADHVEREHYPAGRVGTALPAGVAVIEGSKTALLGNFGLPDRTAVRVRCRRGLHRVLHRHRVALLGREYFELAAMRFRPPAEAKAMR